MDSFDIESLIHLEQSFFDKGYSEGYASGRLQGLTEGKNLGVEKGFEIWEELGFYEGFASALKAISIKQGRNVNDRVFHRLNQLLELISLFPTINPTGPESENLDVEQLHRQIQSRYKALSSSIGVKPTSLRSNDL